MDTNHYQVRICQARCTSLRMDTNHYQVRALIYTYLLLLRTGTHTYGMDEPITCAEELEEWSIVAISVGNLSRWQEGNGGLSGEEILAMPSKVFLLGRRRRKGQPLLWKPEKARRRSTGSGKGAR